MPKKRTKLIEVRIARGGDKKDHGADAVFVRLGDDRKLHTIYASSVGGSYHQWGADREVLGDNVDAVTRWAKHPDRLDPALY